MYIFICLVLLILASQRVETLLSQWFGSEETQTHIKDALKLQRGQPPTILETTILIYIIGKSRNHLYIVVLFLIIIISSQNGSVILVILTWTCNYEQY